MAYMFVEQFSYLVFGISASNLQLKCAGLISKYSKTPKKNPVILQNELQTETHETNFRLNSENRCSHIVKQIVKCTGTKIFINTNSQSTTVVCIVSDAFLASPGKTKFQIV